VYWIFVWECTVALTNNNNNNNNNNVSISKSFRKYVSTIPGNHEVRNCRKLPYWALHTYFGKC
jgi:hypothetical protein